MAPPVTVVRPPARRLLGLALAGVLLGVVAGAGFGWQHHVAQARRRAALPRVAQLSANPTLRERLDQAHRAAREGDLAAMATLGRLCHANGFATEAAACWQLLAREQPKEARWHYYLADLHRSAGDQAAAERELELTVALAPEAAPAWLQLAEMKFKSGRSDAADSDYQRRLALLPGDPYAELGLARLAQQRGRSAETMERLERILKQHPEFSVAQNLYAELQSAAGREDLADWHRWLGREAGRFREADDAWMDALNDECLDPLRLCHLGTVAYQARRGDRGRSRFQRAIQLAPGDPLAFQLLGELTLGEGAPEKARELLQRGIDGATSGTPTPAHYLKLHEALRALQRPDDARRCLEAGLARHPDAAELHHALGKELAATGDRAGALAAQRRALALNPSLVEADLSLALLSLEQGQREAAVALLQDALKQQPTFPQALILLGRLEMDAGRAESAGRYLLPLLKANPGMPEARQIVARWRDLAGRQVERSDPAAAERHYRAGLELLPDDATLNGSLGTLLFLGGRIEEAIAPLEKSRQAAPASADVSLFLAQAYARTGRVDEARRVLADGLQRAEAAGQTATARNFREILSILSP